VSRVQLVLEQGSASVLVTAEPATSRIQVDGVLAGMPPVRLPRLSLGPHTFAAFREGYLPAETTLIVTQATGQIDLTLVKEPPGVLIVQGDRPAQIYIDDELVRENVQNSGPRELARGPHKVRVILRTGQTIDKLVTIESRERAVYDFSQDTITRRPSGER
jgi:hypothetical protein